MRRLSSTLITTIVLLSCAGDDTELSLSEGSGPMDWTEHRRRMNVVILDSMGDQSEQTPQEVAQILADNCANLIGDGKMSSCSLLSDPPDPSTLTDSSVSNGQQGNCRMIACNAAHYLCVAHGLLEIANAAGPMELSSSTIPPQSRATRAALAEQSVLWAREATVDAITGLRDAAGLQTGALTCAEGNNGDGTTDVSEGNELDDSLYYELSGNPPDIGETLGTTVAEGFWLMREATEATYRGQLAVADEQYSSQASLARANRFAYDAPVLSRGHVASFLLGNNNSDGDTDDALPNLEQSPLCPTEADTPEVEAAIASFRESGVSPTELADTATIDIDQLVTGTTTAKSVSERLRLQYGSAAIPTTGADIYNILGANRAAFTRARQILNEQIAATGRDISAEMPARPITGSGTAVLDNTEFIRYAAVARPAVTTEPARWTTLARGAPTPFAHDNTGMISMAQVPADEPGLARRSVSHAMDYVYTAVRQLLYLQSGSPYLTASQGLNNALAPLLSQSEQEHSIKIEVFAPGGAGTDAKLSVPHRNQGTFQLVLGTAGISCAVHGHVEGVDCDIDDYLVTSTQQSGTLTEHVAGFSHYTFWTLVEGTTDRPTTVTETLYGVVVLPPSGTNEPGAYLEMGSVTIPSNPTSTYYDIYTPNPWAEDLAVDALEVDPEECARPKESCAGIPYDQRIPLENELSEDGNGFENSWRTYLNLARQAADESDLLGEEIVRQGLEMDIRAEAALDELADACGGSVNVDVSGTFAPDATFNEFDGTTCTSNGDCGEGKVCEAGGCIADPVGRLLDGEPDDDSPEESRVRSCLGDLGEGKFVTLGSRPLCVFVHNDNPNNVCADETGECPYLATLNSMTEEYECTRSADVNPMDYTSEKVEPLGLFLSEETVLGGDQEDSPATRAEVCTAFRRMRTGNHSADEEALLRSTRVFDPSSLENMAAALEWNPEPFDVATVRRGGEAWFGTGSLRTGYGSVWPCGDPDPSFGCSDETMDDTFFCSQVISGCAVQGNRAVFNNRIAEALLAAKVLTGAGVEGLRWPIHLTTSGDAADHDGDRRNVFVHEDLSASGLIRAPKVTFECPAGEKRFTSGSAWNAASYWSESTSSILWHSVAPNGITTGWPSGHSDVHNYPVAFVSLKNDETPASGTCQRV